VLGMVERTRCSPLLGAAFRVLLVAAMVLPLLNVRVASAFSPATAFQMTWQRTDLPVADGTVQRTWMWGPTANSGPLPEPYVEGSGATRTIQYYDKSRMELNDPNADSSSPWYVTNGLLVVELITGRLQIGDDAFVNVSSSHANVAGDPDDLHGPTYTSLAGVLAAPPATLDTTLTERLLRDGSVIADPDLAARAVRAAFVDDVTHHAIAAPFWAFMTSVGLIWDGALVEGQLFVSPFYATGRPITEAYWTTVRVGGSPQDVLLQCFERRCLTYTPDNPDGWQVEAGNVGQHYYGWRYEPGHDIAIESITQNSASTVTHRDGLALTISAAAISADGVATIAKTASPHHYPDYDLIGSAWDVALHGAEIVAPIVLSFETRLSGSDLNGALVAYLDEEAGAWRPVPTVVNDETGRVQVTTTHLSIWAVFVPLDDSEEHPPSPPSPPTPPSPPSPPDPGPNAKPAVDLNGPDADGADVSLSVVGGADGVLVASGATLTDADDTTLDSMFITLQNAPDGSDEVLSVTALPSVVLSRDTDGRALQIQGPAPIGTFQAILRSLTYQHSGRDASPGDRRIAVRIHDGRDDSETRSATVTVAPDPNRAPVAEGMTVATDEDTAVSMALIASDPDGDTLTWTIESSPAHGDLSGAAPNLTYTPDPDFHGSDLFSWSVSDGELSSSVATVTITITAVNDRPVAHATSITTLEDESVQITLTADDADGDALTFSVTGQPQYGSLDGNGSELTYQPAFNFVGSDQFTFVVSDGPLESEPAVVTIDVVAVDDPPVAQGQTVTTEEDVPVAISLTAVDDSDALTYRVVAQPAHGTLSGSGAELIYTPDENYHGDDTFTFVASDGTHESEPADVDIQISPVNDAPVATSQQVTLPEDGSATITLVATDVDGDPLSVAVSDSSLTLGTVAIVGETSCDVVSSMMLCSQQVIYTPDANAHGDDIFSFSANDGVLTSLVEIDISILQVNDPPLANDDDLVGVDEDSVDVAVDVLSNDSIAPDENETLTIVGFSDFSAGGSARTVDGFVLYTPAADFNGTETFRYSISDGNGGTASAIVTVIVLPVNDPPTATDDVYEMDEDGGSIVLDLLANDSAAPDEGETIAIAWRISPRLGAVDVNPGNGELRYTPAPNRFGTDTFRYGIEDSNGGRAEAYVTITVHPVNDPPTAVDDAAQIGEDAETIFIDVLRNDSFSPDDDEMLFVASVGAASLGTAAVAADGSGVSYTPHADAFGTDSFSYTLSDDGGATTTGAVSVEILPVNDAPELSLSVTSLDYQENAPPIAIASDLSVIDIDSQIVSAVISFVSRPDGPFETLSIDDSIGISHTVDPETGAITLAGSATPDAYQQILQSLRYVHNSDAPTAGERAVTITISDGVLEASTPVTVTVIPVNDPPVLVFGGSVVRDDAPVLVDSDATLFDVDSPNFEGGQLTATIITGFADGDVLSVTPSGALGLSGGALTWDAGGELAVIGEAAQSEGSLVMTFTQSATPDRVAAVVRALTFASTSTSMASRAIAVVVTDGDGGTSSTGIVTIGVNSPPDDIAIVGATLPEGVHDGTIVGTVTAHDPDDDALALSIAPDSDARFVLLMTGDEWALQTSSDAAFDYETEPSIDVEIVATDPFGRTYSETVTITITDVNEAPALVTPSSVELAENSAVDTVVATVGASDPDSGQSHTFAITAGNDSGAFTINATSGAVSVADSAPLDYESTTSFELTITVTDNGSPPLSGSGTLTVVITDVVEDGVDTQPPTIGTLSYGPLLGNLRFSADAEDGLLSTTVDPEGSAVTLVDVESLSGPESGAFTWDADGGFTFDPRIGMRTTTVIWLITVEDAAENQATALVKLVMSSRAVWHVDQTYAGGASTGSWNAPFVAINEVTGNSQVKVNDIVYVATGVAPYTGTIELGPGQMLIGQGSVADTFAELVNAPVLERGTYLSPAINGIRPTITTTNGPGIKLSTGNLIAGLTIGGTRGAAIDGVGSSNDEGPTIRDVAISGTSTNLGPALYVRGYGNASMSFVSIERKMTQPSGAQGVIHVADIRGGTLVVEGSLTLSSSAARGLMLERFGSAELRGAVTINTESYEGMYINTTPLALSGAFAHAVTTTSATGVYVRKQSELIVMGGSLRVSVSNSNALDVADSLLELPGSGNTLDATNGTGLWLYNVTIGSGGAAFDRINSTYATNGIYVDGLTSNGPLTVGPTGDGHAFGDGGTIAGMSGPAVLLRYASDVTLRHLVIGEPSASVDESATKTRATDGAGVDAYVVSGLTLDHVKIARTGGHGIRGREVTNFAMHNSQIINAGDTAGEHALSFQGGDGDSLNGVAGSFTVTNSVIASFWDTGIDIANYPDVATESSVAVSGTAFSGNAVAGGAIRIHAGNNSTIHLSVDSCTYVNLQGPEVSTTSAGSGVIVLPEP